MINAPIRRRHNNDTDFYRAWTTINGLTIDVFVDEPQHVVLQGQMDVHHRGIVSGVIGVGGGLSFITAPTLAQLPALPTWNTPPGTFLTESIQGCNILSEDHHYGKLVWFATMLLQPGAYRFMAHANSHSTINNNTIDGLAEVLIEGGQGRNCLIATFHKP